MADKSFSLAGMNESSRTVQTFKTALEKASGQKIAFTTIDKMNKTAGEISKSLHFGLENGQKVTFVLRADGDAFRVRLNEKDLPISGDLDPNYKPTFNAAIKTIAESVRGNQAKFNKQLTKEKVKIPAGSKAVATSTQIKAIQEELIVIDTQLTEKAALRDDLKLKLEQKKAQQIAV